MPPKKTTIPTVEEVLEKLRLPRAEVQRLFDAVKGREPQRTKIGIANRPFRQAERKTSELVDLVKRREAVLLDGQLPRFVGAAFERVQAAVEELRRAVFDDLRLGVAAEAITFSGLPGVVTDFDSLLLHLTDLVRDRPTAPRQVLRSNDLAVLCAEFASHRFRALKEAGRFRRDDIEEIAGRLRSYMSKRRAELEPVTRGVAPDGKRHQRQLRAPNVVGPLVEEEQQLAKQREQRKGQQKVKGKRKVTRGSRRSPQRSQPGALSDANFQARASAAPGTMRADRQGTEMNLTSSRRVGRGGDEGLPEMLRLESNVLRRKTALSVSVSNIKLPKK